MAKRIKKGPISKAVHNLCSNTLFEPINESKFKDGLRKIIDEYQQRFLRNIGMAIQAWLSRYATDKTERVWCLVDEVDPRVRDEYERWAEPFFGGDIKVK